ncbi:MAG: PD-(D/E)XK nuclease family protein [Bacteroidia bacterium]
MPKSTTLTLSARDVAQLVYPDFCPMRFWIEKRLKPPSEPFPALPGAMDRLLKEYTEDYWTNHRKLPTWFDTCPIGGQPLLPRPSWRTFWTPYTTSKGPTVRIHGEPDEILLPTSSEVIIVDYKLSDPKDKNSGTALMYAVQVVVYAYIAMRTPASPFPKTVSGLYLLYFSLDKPLSVHVFPSALKLATTFTPSCVQIDPCDVAKNSK